MTIETGFHRISSIEETEGDGRLLGRGRALISG